MRRLLLISLPVAVVLALAGCSQGEPQQLAVGDCLMISGVGDSVGDVPVVPCDGPHEAEVYLLFEVADADAYDEQAVVAEVEERCVTEFEGFVGEPFSTSSLDTFYTYPLADGWDGGGREAMCAAFAPDPDTGRPLTFEGSLGIDG